MRQYRFANYAGVAAFIIFWAALLLVASLDPSYSQNTKMAEVLYRDYCDRYTIVRGLCSNGRP